MLKNVYYHYCNFSFSYRDDYSVFCLTDDDLDEEIILFCKYEEYREYIYNDAYSFVIIRELIKYYNSVGIDPIKNVALYLLKFCNKRKLNYEKELEDCSYTFSKFFKDLKFKEEYAPSILEEMNNLAIFI